MIMQVATGLCMDRTRAHRHERIFAPQIEIEAIAVIPDLA
jgi:hypothetical protein